MNSQPGREWAWIFLVNCLVTLVLQLGYVLGLSSALHGASKVAFVLAMVSQAGFINLIPAALTAWPMLGWRHRTWARLVTGFIFVLFQLAVLADIVIFRLFQRHFDSLVWNLLTTKGAGDSVRVDSASMVITAAILLIFICACLAFALWAVPRLAHWRLRFGFIVILLALLGERTFFAAIDLRDHSTLQAVRDTLPFYQPLTIKRLAKRFGYRRPPAEVRLLADSAKSLHLPKQPLGLSAANAHTPNILFIVIEGGRADALEDITMPNLSWLAGDSYRLVRHFSAGNETRFGMFGLIYGVSGTYWNRVLAQSVAPPMFDLLDRCGYEFKILSCTDLNYPEFRQTIFVKLTNSIVDRWNAPHLERDRLMTDHFIQYLADRAGRAAVAPPFFGFMFFDASHQPYEHPPEDEVHPGSKSGKINYLNLTLSPAGAAALKGSYLNSLHYIDRHIGRVVQALNRNNSVGKGPPIGN